TVATLGRAPRHMPVECGTPSAPDAPYEMLKRQLYEFFDRTVISAIKAIRRPVEEEVNKAVEKVAELVREESKLLWSNAKDTMSSSDVEQAARSPRDDEKKRSELMRR